MRQTEIAFQNMFFHVPDFVIITDEQFVLKDANLTAQTHFGISPVTLVPFDLLSILPPSLHPEIYAFSHSPTRELELPPFEIRTVLNQSLMVLASLYKSTVQHKTVYSFQARQIFHPAFSPEDPLAAFNEFQKREIDFQFLHSEEKLQMAIEAGQLGLWFWDLQTMKMETYGSCQTMFDIPPNQTVFYDMWLETIHPEDRNRVQQTIESALETKSLFRVEFRITWLGGYIHWIVAQGRALYNGKDEIIAMVITTQDITEFKKTETELQEMRDRNDLLADLINNSTQIMAAGLEDGSIIMFNPAAVHLLGYTSEELYQVNWKRDLISPEKTHNLAALLRQTPSLHYEQEFRHKDGHYIPVDILVQLLPGKNGRPDYFYCFVTDITERKKVENALQISEAKFRTLFELLPLAMAIFDVVYDDAGEPVNLRYVNLNPLKTAFRDRKMEDTIGALVTDFYRLPHPPGWEQYLTVIQTGKPIQFEIFLPPTERHFRVHAFSTQVDQICAIYEDITLQKQIQAEILEMNMRLEEKVKRRTLQLEQTIAELEAFSYSVSHDLRSPLRGINGWSMALLEDYNLVLDSQGKDYIARVISESQRMGQIIDAQLQLARITRTKLHFSHLNISFLAEEIAQRLQRSLPDRNLQFQIQQNIMAQADRNTLNIVLTNLLDNACKFTSGREQALISFGHLLHNQKEVYYVRDNGVGFQMSKADKLFSPFQRLHKASEFPGSGIGLATVKRIISRYGGKIWAEANPDAGSTFYFTLGEHYIQ